MVTARRHSNPTGLELRARRPSQPRLGMWRSRYRGMGTRHGSGFRHTPMEKYSVSVMVPKYAAVNGSLGPEKRCVAYAMGPWRMAQDARKSTDPTVQLIKTGLAKASSNGSARRTCGSRTTHTRTAGDSTRQTAPRNGGLTVWRTFAGAKRAPERERSR